MYKHFIKRAIDILLSFMGGIVLLPVFLFIAIAIEKDDLGPIILSRSVWEKVKNFFGYINFAV